jgi:hypothetical protein
MRASRVGAAIGTATMVLVARSGVVWAAPTPDPCQDKTGGALAMCQALNVPGQPVQSTASSAAGSAEVQFVQWLANGAGWLIVQLSKVVLSNTTTPNLDPQAATQGGFWAVYVKVDTLALLLAALLVIGAVLQGVIKSNPRLPVMAAAWFVFMGLLNPLIVWLIATSLGVVDDWSTWLASNLQQDVPTSLGNISKALAAWAGTGAQPPGAGSGDTYPSASGAGSLALAAGSLACAVSAFVVWIELLGREVLVYLLVLLTPMTTALGVWDRLRAGLGRVVEFIAVVVCSKLLIVIVLVGGFAMLGVASNGQDGFQGLVVAVVMLALAAAAPIALWAFLPRLEDRLAQAHQGLLQRGGAWAMDTSQEAIVDKGLAAFGLVAGQSELAAAAGAGAADGRAKIGDTPPPASRPSADEAGDEKDEGKEAQAARERVPASDSPPKASGSGGSEPPQQE